MEKYRVKIITGLISNIQKNPDEIVSISDDIQVLRGESVCDYNILIVDLRAIRGSQMMNLNHQDFRDFLNKPSVILCIADEESTYEHYSLGSKWTPKFSNYDWLPNKDEFKIKNRKGESLKTTVHSGRFNGLFVDYDWQWQCTFSPLNEDTSSYVSIADNITGQNIALRMDIREGIIIIIPKPKIPDYDTKGYSAFLRTLIELNKKEVEVLTEREKEEPDWVEKHVVPEELELRERINKLQQQYQILTDAHKLLYEADEALTQAVHLALNGMGFNSEMKEKEGTHDIEVNEEDMNLVFEVTSSDEDWINIRKTRQLLDWCRRYEREQGKKPKGILIANAYCSLPLPERDEPFTTAALKQGEAEGFCLMTTEQLYKIFCKFLKDEVDKDNIKELLLETKGLLKFEG